MSYSSEVAKNEFTLNVIIEIAGEYYGTYQPDSGLVIDKRNLVLDDLNVSGTTLDLRTISTPVGGVNFKLKDEDEYITIKIMQDDSQFIQKEVKVFVGFITGSFDFSQYKNISNVRINSVTKITNGYSIRAKEVTDLLTAAPYNVSDILNTNLIPVSTTLTLEDASEYPLQGLIRIGAEFIRYDGIVGDTLQNLARGQVGSTAANHEIGAEVFYVTEVVAQNPIDAILQLIISKNGDNSLGEYDVYAKGLAIPEALVDVAKFEQVRDDNFQGEQFTLYMFNQNNTLRYIEAELLRATNTRLFSKDGIISISLLDQVDAAATVPTVSEDSIIETPTWQLGSDKLVNVINIRYDYDDVSGKFNKSRTFRDEESIEKFGEKKALKLRFRGVKAALDGDDIVNNRGNRLLLRLSTPRGKITVRSFFDQSELNVGDKIVLEHRYLPKQGGSLGVTDQLEIMSKSLDLKQGRVSFRLEYTSFTGIRLAYIGPSPKITAVIDQKTFEVPDGSCYVAGMALRLFDKVTATYYPDVINFIEEVNGNTITMANDFTTILTTNITVKMADYNSNSNVQNSRYASIGENSGKFDDDTKSYQIIF